MRKFYYSVLTLLHFILYPVYRVVIRSSKSYSEYNMFLNKLHCPYTDFKGFLWLFLHFPEYRSIVYHRHHTTKRLYSFLYKPQVALQIDTPSEALGEGLMLWHGYSTILNAASIGKNFTCWHNVTVGNKLDEGEQKPVIKDNVKICTGAVVIGNITIGNNVIIGAGSVVVKDVPDNAVVAGVPAKVIKMQS